MKGTGKGIPVRSLSQGLCAPADWQRCFGSPSEHIHWLLRQFVGAYTLVTVFEIPSKRISPVEGTNANCCKAVTSIDVFCFIPCAPLVWEG